MTVSGAVVAVSPYKEAGARLIDAGYSALPIEPGTKRPGAMLFGKWHGLSDWTRFCDRIPTDYEVPSWEGYPDSGVCVATGFNGLIAIRRKPSTRLRGSLNRWPNSAKPELPN
jgi:hypothetical protein